MPLLVNTVAHQACLWHVVASCAQFLLETLCSHPGLCRTELLCLIKLIPPVSLMWSRDWCLNQRSFCFYAEMWALGSAALLCCLCFCPNLSPSFFFAFSVYLSMNTLSFFNWFPPVLTPPCCLLTDSFFCHGLSLFMLFFFTLNHLSISHPFPLSPLPLNLPSSHHRSPPSVPAGGRGPLCAAAAAQGQLLAGGDEAG